MTVVNGTREDMLNQIDAMREFQLNNCKDCFFAEAKKVGTATPCCTYPSQLRVEDSKCQCKRQGKPRI